MRRFGSRLAHYLWILLVAVFGVIISEHFGLISSYVIAPLISREPGAIRDTAMFFADRPYLIVPTAIAATFILVGIWSAFEAYAKGLPLIGVDMMPWRGPRLLKGKDGRSKPVQCAFVTLQNKTESISRDAVAESVGVGIRLTGKKLRMWSDSRGVWIDRQSNVLGQRINLNPDDTYCIVIAMESAKEKRMVAVTDNTFDSYSMDSPMGWPLNEALYLVRLRIRGIGVNTHLWFALGNFVVERDSLGIWGPLGLLERIWVRLTLLGVRPDWRPYIGAKPPSSSRSS